MSIDERWLQSIDRIITASIVGKKRIIGLTSPTGGAGVTLLSGVLAESFALSGVNTLLIDLSTTSDKANEASDGWIPVLKDPDSYLQKNSDGHDFLESRPDHKNRFIFNNIKKIRDVFNTQLSSYDTIILDIPAVNTNKSSGINAISCAAACDLIYLVCLTGKVTSSELREVKSQFATANVPLHGTILNDRDYIPTGESMSRSLLRKKSFLPGMEKLAARVRKMEILK